MLKKLEQKLTRHKNRYLIFTSRAYGVNTPKNCILFALLSVNTSYEVNAKAFSAMKDKDWLNHRDTMNELMRHGVHYAAARASYIIEAFQRLNDRALDLYWNKETESIQDYRDRLVKDIKGLSWIKVSFLISLLYGQEADICCLDRWMLRALGSDKPEETMKKIGRHGPLPRKRYELLENKLRKGAKRIGIPLCAYQWGIWDIIQSEQRLKSNPMKALWV